MKNEVVNTQIRLPAQMFDYIKQEAAEMGISQNAFMLVLMNHGKKLWEATADADIHIGVRKD